MPWTTVGQAGPDEQTSNIAAVIQEIVNRPGWSSGNALAIIITGTGKRVAESFNGVSSAAALGCMLSICRAIVLQPHPASRM